MGKLSTTEYEKTYDVAKKLIRGLTASPANIHLDLIASYLQEAMYAGKTGHWILEEAAEKIK